VRGKTIATSKWARRRTGIFERDAYRCVYCGQVFDARHLTIDHVEPRTKLGDQSLGNLVTACQACNLRKGGRAAWDWLGDRPAERENFLRYATHVWDRLRRAVERAGQ
jgi:5-methylcytosine-specific restriction endonuclease McrA